jgi:diaminopimelate epimerase
MKIAFTKMQGAGNDFVVIDATTTPLALSSEQWRKIADRRFGVGADQILIVEAADSPEVDFVYRIFNADGQEVEQCGNGARCFARFVRDHGLSRADTIRVKTKSGIIAPTIHADGSVTVDMGAPKWAPTDVGFDPDGLPHRLEQRADLFALSPPGRAPFWVSLVSMGNPHAVQFVDDLANHPVGDIGAWCEAHPRFRYRVNAGFAEKQSSQEIDQRVLSGGRVRRWPAARGPVRRSSLAFFGACWTQISRWL